VVTDFVVIRVKGRRMRQLKLGSLLTRSVMRQLTGMSVRIEIVVLDYGGLSNPSDLVMRYMKRLKSKWLVFLRTVKFLSDRQSVLENS
jgi:hypothetical protein